MKRANRGLTLIEVLIASVILAFIVAAIFILVFQGGTTYADASRHVTLQRNARAVLERISQELRFCDPNNLTVNFDAGTKIGTIQYRRSEGYDEALETHDYSPNILITYKTSNVDANNNGVLDEGKVTMTEYNEDNATVLRESILCDYVKPGGFVVSRDGTTGVIKITLTMAVQDANSKEMSTTVSTSVILRNKS